MRFVFAAICLATALLLVLAGAVAIFRLACYLTGVQRPAFSRSIAIVTSTFIVLSITEALLVSVIRTIYQQVGAPLWEVGIVAFFLG
ncbi:MAG: hypothetical protein ACRCZF_10585, partial [Gemmataceae bacterium]